MESDDIFLSLTYNHLLSHGKKGIMGNKGVTYEINTQSTPHTRDQHTIQQRRFTNMVALLPANKIHTKLLGLKLKSLILLVVKAMCWFQRWFVVFNCKFGHFTAAFTNGYHKC